MTKRGTPTVASRRLASEVFLRAENSVCVFAIAILAALRARRADVDLKARLCKGEKATTEVGQCLTTV